MTWPFLWRRQRPAPHAHQVEPSNSYLCQDTSGSRSLFLVCEYGRFDLSYEPAAMGGYEELLPNACKVIIEADGDRIEVLCADIRDIVRSKKPPAVRKTKNPFLA